MTPSTLQQSITDVQRIVAHVRTQKPVIGPGNPPRKGMVLRSGSNPFTCSYFRVIELNQKRDVLCLELCDKDGATLLSDKHLPAYTSHVDGWQIVSQPKTLTDWFQKIRRKIKRFYWKNIRVESVDWEMVCTWGGVLLIGLGLFVLAVWGGIRGW